MMLCGITPGTSAAPLLKKVGTVLDWKLFKGYGFVQENITGARHFCPRKAANGALFLRPGDAVRFELEQRDVGDRESSGLERCASVTHASGAPFEQQEIQGIVMEVPSNDSVGVICRVGKFSSSLGATVSPSTTHSSMAAPVAGAESDEGRLFHYSFSHSRALSVGDMVRFWSRDNTNKRRVAKDVVAVDPAILSPEELRLLESTKQLVNRQVPRSVEADVKFRTQQWQPLRDRSSDDISSTNAGATGTSNAPLNTAPDHAAQQAALTAPTAQLELDGSQLRMQPCVVEHFQGRYGKLRVMDKDNKPLIVFFHTDMVNRKPHQISTGLKGICAFDRVRQGKNAGTLRAHRVIFPEITSRKG